MDRRITPEQWVLHLDAAEQAGGLLSAYAREHGLNVQHLYAARQRQRRLVARQAGNALDAPQPSAFATVQVKTSAIAPVAKLSATLPMAWCSNSTSWPPTRNLSARSSARLPALHVPLRRVASGTAAPRSGRFP
jgi:hypothetical protein